MAHQDASWLEKLYNEQYITVYKLVRHLLSALPAEDAHDIVQETFLLAYQKKISKHPKPEAWLYVTARNLCKNRVRVERSHRKKLSELQNQHLAHQPTKAYESSVEADTDVIDAMLTLQSTLSATDFELLKEICIKGTPIEQVSNQTGLSVNNIRVRLHRIREKAKSILVFIMVLLTIE